MGSSVSGATPRLTRPGGELYNSTTAAGEDGSYGVLMLNDNRNLYFVVVRP
ncbi:MAG: hypothetical protein AAFS10_03645 [Myxococcota bacterium]